MMLPIAEKLDNAGFEGIELISGSHLKKAVRELREDPWEHVRLVAKEITKTPLRLIAGRVNTFEYNPPSMYRLFVEHMENKRGQATFAISGCQKNPPGPLFSCTLVC